VFLPRLMDGRLRWTLVFWLFVLSAVAYLDRVNVSIAAQAIQTEHHLSNVQLGWVFSAFVVGYALFQAPGGRLADRFGPRRVIGMGVAWWSVFTTLTALVPSGVGLSIVLLVSVRFLLGAGEAVIYPAANRMVANWIPSPERGLANGVIFAGVGVGAGITPPLIAYVLLHGGWQWSFYACAMLGLGAGLIWYLLARDTPRAHPWIGAHELACIEAGHASAGASTETRPVSGWGAIASDRNLVAIASSYFTVGYVAYIFYTWFFTYLTRVRGLDLKSTAVYSMLPFLAMAICSPLGGWISDRIARRHGKRAGRCGVAAFGLALGAVFLAAATQVAGARLACVVLAGGAGALCLAQSAYWAVTADIAGRAAGAASGFVNTGAQIGGAVTASLTPWIADRFGWTASFLVAAALCTLGSLAWLAVDPHASLDASRRHDGAVSVERD
jgi:MFS transporter, ACS family, glucarate transporter